VNFIIFIEHLLTVPSIEVVPVTLSNFFEDKSNMRHAMVTDVTSSPTLNNEPFCPVY